MKKILVVVDMQKDFIDGALGTPEAVSVLPRVIEKIEGFAGVTQKSHENALEAMKMCQIQIV